MHKRSQWGTQLDALIRAAKFDVRAAAQACEQLYRASADEGIRSAASGAISSLRLAMEDPRDPFCLTVARNRCIGVRGLLRQMEEPMRGQMTLARARLAYGR
jgi:hypothetical protein